MSENCKGNGKPTKVFIKDANVMDSKFMEINIPKLKKRKGVFTQKFKIPCCESNKDLGLQE